MQNFYVLARPNGANLVIVSRAADGVEQRSSVTVARVHDGDQVQVSIIEGMPVFEIRSPQPLTGAHLTELSGGQVEANLETVKRVISTLLPDCQRRVAFIAGTLRELLPTEDRREFELALRLVLAETAR
jgi:hypothetical protein